jgi:hypothetical protein
MLNCSDNLPRSRKEAITIKCATDFDEVKAFIIVLIQQSPCSSLIKIAKYGLCERVPFQTEAEFSHINR